MSPTTRNDSDDDSTTNDDSGSSPTMTQLPASTQLIGDEATNHR